MSTGQIAPYGTWKSPITSDLIVAETIWLRSPELDGDDTYWLELRPGENGRFALVRCTLDGVHVDVVPMPFDVRTRVHEYGGNAYTVAAGVVYF